MTLERATPTSPLRCWVCDMADYQPDKAETFVRWQHAEIQRLLDKQGEHLALIDSLKERIAFLEANWRRVKRVGA